MAKILPIVEKIQDRQLVHDGLLAGIQDTLKNHDGLFAGIQDTLKNHDGLFADIQDRLKIHERTLNSNTELLTFMSAWLTKEFAAIDRRFAGIDSRLNDMMAYFKMRDEEWRSDFRSLREMQKHQDLRCDGLETRICHLETRPPR